jgi:lipopolysaccharide/colanic/teichoic acid biosynthesis glycosyltransferase
LAQKVPQAEVPVKILNFRTMTVLEDGATITQAVRGDSRVTRFDVN